MRRALQAGITAATVALAVQPVDGAQRPACDRACLVDTLNRYVEAVLAHDPLQLSVSRNIRFTENLVPLQFGRQGLWATANGRRDFNIYITDAARGDAVWIGILKENDKPVMVAIRLKVADRRITEAETLVGRVGLGAADTVAGPRPEYTQPIAPAEQSSRDELIAIARSNWDAMEQGNGDLAPYAADCERYDNGRRTTNGPSPGRQPGAATNAQTNTSTGAAPNAQTSLLANSQANSQTTSTGAAPSPGDVSAAANRDIGSLGCYGQMNSGRFKNGNKVDPRRIWAVDPEFGLVVGLFTPNVPGTARTLTLRGGQTLTVGPDELIPFTIEQVELFRIVRGQISRVEVVLGPRVPYGMRSPFDMKSLWDPR